MPQQAPAEPPPPGAARLSLRKARTVPAHTASQPPPERAQVSSASGAPGGDIILAGSSIQPCPHTVTPPMIPKMTTGTRRIPAVTGGQRPRSDLVEDRGSNPRRIMLRQRTLSVRHSPAFPFPWKVFPGKSSLESVPWVVLPGKFSLHFFPWKVFPGKF